MLSGFVTLQRETPSSCRRVCMNCQTQPDHLSQSTRHGKPPNFPILSQGISAGQAPLLPASAAVMQTARCPDPFLGGSGGSDLLEPSCL